jgi:hypothetical protein
MCPSGLLQPTLNKSSAEVHSQGTPPGSRGKNLNYPQSIRPNLESFGWEESKLDGDIVIT